MVVLLERLHLLRDVRRDRRAARNVVDRTVTVRMHEETLPVLVEGGSDRNLEFSQLLAQVRTGDEDVIEQTVLKV